MASKKSRKRMKSRKKKGQFKVQDIKLTRDYGKPTPGIT